MMKQSMEILIPAYNEEKNIEIVVKKSLSWLKSLTKDYRTLVINDASIDNTKRILNNLSKKNKNLKVIHNKKNKGIGEAWKKLYKNSSKEILFTCPADQQFDPSDFSKTLAYLDKAEIISIYRQKKQQYNLFRNFLSITNRLLIKILFDLDIRDINWVKMYKRKIFQDFDLKLTSPLIETEIFAKAKKRKYKIIQVGAPHHPRLQGKSKGANFKQLSRVLLDLVILKSIIIKFK